MVDSITTSLISKSGKRDPSADVASAGSPDEEMGHVSHYGHGLHHSNGKELGSNLQLLRYRVIAIVKYTFTLIFFFNLQKYNTLNLNPSDTFMKLKVSKRL